MEKRCLGRSIFLGAGVLGIGLGVVLVLGTIDRLNSWPGSPAPGEGSLVASNAPAAVRRLDVPWYIKRDQWSADMRTLQGMLRYLTGTGELAQTNSASGRTDV